MQQVRAGENVERQTKDVLLLAASPDDVPTLRAMLDRATEISPGRFRYCLDCVATPSEAVEQIERGTVDVLLLDISKRHGLPLQDLVERGVLTPELPVLLLAEAEDEAMGYDAVALGAQDYLIKRLLNPYWLLNALHYAIDRHGALRQVREYAARLQASEARLRRIIEQNADGILIIDQGGRIQYFNQAAQDLLGRSSDELAGAEWGFPVLRDGLCELDITRLDGHQAVVEMRMVSIAWEGNSAYLASLRDITDHKRLQRALEHTADNLERSNDELRLFADIASHDLREPLRSTTLYLELLTEKYEGAFDDEADYLIRAALDGGRRMRQLIDDLLEYTRIDTQAIASGPVNMEMVLQQTLTHLQASIEECEATVTYDPLPTVQGDDSQFEQVFQNLLSNALKFRGEAPPHIHVSAVSQADTWRFSIADNGIGIQPEYTGRIFGMFERLHNRDAYPGTGIGLAICEKVITRHGGRIWVESEPDTGATFYFTLPRRD